MNKWPKQSECRMFYGIPGGTAFESNMLILVKVPFLMHMDDLKITRIRIHKKCAASLARVLYSVSLHANVWHSDAPELEFSGSYNFRSMRGGRSLSMHAYGCAVDIGAAKNPMGRPGSFTETNPWVVAFEAEGWTWGGRWKGKSCDPMHFQAASVG